MSTQSLAVDPALTVSPATKLAYGIGQAAEGIKNNAFSLFLLFFYVQVHGLSSSLAGVALFVSLCFDAVTDPVTGYVSDAWRSRWGRRHPFMYASAIPLAVTFYFIFSPPDGLGQWGLFAWLTIFSILVRTAITLFFVPHIALGAELSSNYEERTSIVSYRVAFGVVGSLLVFASVTIFFPDEQNGSPGQMVGSNYSTFALICAIVMWMTIWLSAFGTHNRIPYLAKVEGERQLSMTDMFNDVLQALQNPNFRALFLAVLVSLIAAGISMSLNLFMFTFFWELDSSNLQKVLIAYPIGVFLGTAITSRVHSAIGKRTTLAVAWGCWAIFQMLPTTARLLDFLPANDSTLLLYIIIAAAFAQGISSGLGAVSFGSMIADVADDHELRTGERHEGLLFAALSFASKATSGLGGLLAGVGLDLIDWPSGQHITAADIPAETLVALGILFGPVVAFFCSGAVWFCLRYRLTRDMHAEIQSKLRSKAFVGH